MSDSTRQDLTLSLKGSIDSFLLEYIKQLKEAYKTNDSLLEELDNLIKGLLLFSFKESKSIIPFNLF